MKILSYIRNTDNYVYGNVLLLLLVVLFPFVFYPHKYIDFVLFPCSAILLCIKVYRKDMCFNWFAVYSFVSPFLPLLFILLFYVVIGHYSFKNFFSNYLSVIMFIGIMYAVISEYRVSWMYLLKNIYIFVLILFSFYILFQTYEMVLKDSVYILKVNRNTFVPLITLVGIMSFLEVFWGNKTSLEKYLHAINAVLIYCIMLLSQARCGLSTFLSIWVVIFMHRSEIENKYIGVLSVLTVFAVYYVFAMGRGAEAISDIQAYQWGDSETSLGRRFVIWKIALHAFMEHPFLGWGENYMKEILSMENMSQYISPHVASLPHLHNEFLEMTIHFGMLGTAGLFTAILFLWKRASADIPFQGVLSGIVFAGFFDVYLSHQRLALIVVLLIYLMRHIMEPAYYRPEERSKVSCI